MSSLDDYEFYEQRTAAKYEKRDRKIQRKPTKLTHRQQDMEHQIKNEIADTQGLETGFKPTYQPSRYEAGWLLSSLTAFYDQQLITDVLALVKGGKEASVYCCRAHPSVGTELVAAKVYRPRMFRQLRNDKMYQEGRQILTDQGRAAKETDHRLMRAVNKKTNYGAQVSHQSWLLHEFVTLKTLFNVGAAVPQPHAVAENAILMSYYGEPINPAPLLSELKLEAEEAQPLFDEVIRNIDLMLQHEMIHGDLSAYNILYWEGEITFIDFPQVSNLHSNSNARFILQRDIERVCEYFAKQGVDSEPLDILDQMWSKYAYPKDPIEWE
ncbi:MAG: RIO1 family regulatory kinase/ATPase [Anaerolineae bacterium]